jgi:hypothetical protein
VIALVHSPEITAPFLAGILGNLTQRGLHRHAHDSDAEALIVLSGPPQIARLMFLPLPPHYALSRHFRGAVTSPDQVNGETAAFHFLSYRSRRCNERRSWLESSRLEQAQLGRRMLQLAVLRLFKCISRRMFKYSNVSGPFM